MDPKRTSTAASVAQMGSAYGIFHAAHSDAANTVTGAAISAMSLRISYVLLFIVSPFQHLDACAVVCNRGV